MRDRTFVTHSSSVKLFVTKLRKHGKKYRIGGHHLQSADEHASLLDDASFPFLYLTFSTRRMGDKLINYDRSGW
jgi:hypothetical protein